MYEILMIEEYLNFNGQEPFLAMIWEPDFSQACSFCRMLMDNKNFHFTQIPDKPNDVIFLKSPKTLFWRHFWPFWSFLPNGNFFQNITLNYNTMPSFRKTLWANSEKIYEQTKDRWKDGWKDIQKANGQTLIYRTLRASTRGPKNPWKLTFPKSKRFFL